MKKTWQIKNKLEKKLKAEEIIKLILKEKGLKTKKEIKEFSNPPSPYGIKPKQLGISRREINKAIKRIEKAIINQELMVIYGDYDADGICATALLWEILDSLGAKVMPFIPDREEHGYGLNKEGIDSILELYRSEPLKLLITVDNGIVAHDGINYAQKKEIDVIITDHHQPQIKKKPRRLTKSSSEVNGPAEEELNLPRAQAIVHSTETSGAGVAWFLAREVYYYFKQEKPRRLAQPPSKVGKMTKDKILRGFKASNSLELACIGTVTDVMPLLGVNRSLVKHGLEELHRSQRPGILALCSQTGTVQKEINTFHLGYILGPRLNAMGRLEDALESLRLLCTKKTVRANGLAGKLDFTNRQRQQLTEASFKHAQRSWLQAGEKDKKLIFVSHSSYNPGVIGLVAGKLAREFYRPAVVISQGKEFSKGSARSIKGFNIIQAFRDLGTIFEDVGGHPMAAGFTVKTEKLTELKKKLNSLAKKEIKADLLRPVMEIDLEMNLAEIDWSLLRAVEKLAPFGLGNRRPVFASRDVEVVGIRAVGRDRKHLKLKVRTIGQKRSVPQPRRMTASSSEVSPWPVFEAIGFNLGHLAAKISPGEKIDICYTLQKNVWNGKKSLELEIKDVRG